MLPDRNSDVTLQPEEFRLLRDFISGYCGLYFEEQSLYFLERRLQNRLAENQLATFLDYYYLLLYGSSREKELGCVVDVLTTNETYFFREMNQLRTFGEEIIPEVAGRKKKKRLRLWSAGCSTGEEAYTLAMLVLEHPSLRGWEIEIFASDISQRVLETARKGVYRASSFRSMEPSFREKYFRRLDSSRLRIDDRVRSLVNFGHLNLLQDDRWTILGSFDIIFCRNVMIYFNLESRKRMVDSFHRKLDEGGFLLLGHAESLMNISTAFALRHFRHDMVYQKPLSKSREQVGRAHRE
jgi:chemotaxis protein methyltransferase CheR